MADLLQGEPSRIAPGGRPPLCVMLVAAEASGDALGGALARALRTRLGAPVRFVGVGGARMAGEGIESPFDIAELSVLGILEGVRAYPRVRRRARETAALARWERPDIAVLIDSWGFTLRVAQRLRRLDPALPLIKYVGPQVWASRPGRARTLAGAVDLLLSIHAFDAPHFGQAGLETIFVGNSSRARDFSAADPRRLRARIGAAADQHLGDAARTRLLPVQTEQADQLGQLGRVHQVRRRRAEVERLRQPFGEAVGRLKASHPALRVVVPAAATVADAVKAAVAAWPAPIHLIEDEPSKLDAMAAATAALACSGSVTTELALAGCPMVVAYKMSPLTHMILKRLVVTDWVTLFNIAAGREVARERIQGACTGANLAADLARLLDDPSVRARQIADQSAALDRLGRGQGGDPADRAADAVIAMLQARGRL